MFLIVSLGSSCYLLLNKVELSNLLYTIHRTHTELSVRAKDYVSADLVIILVLLKLLAFGFGP